MENSNVNNAANDSKVEMDNSTIVADAIETGDTVDTEITEAVKDVKNETSEEAGEGSLSVTEENEVVTEEPKDVVDDTTNEEVSTGSDKSTVIETSKVGFENKDNMYAQTQQRTYYTYQQGQSTTGAQVNRTAFDVSANVTNSKATASLVLGIIALISNCICCCLPVSLILSVISLILSISSKKKDPNNKMNGKAIAGLVCSIVAIVAYIITLIVVILSITSTILDPEFQNELNAMLSEYGYEIVF